MFTICLLLISSKRQCGILLPLQNYMQVQKLINFLTLLSLCFLCLSSSFSSVNLTTISNHQVNQVKEPKSIRIETSRAKPCRNYLSIVEEENKGVLPADSSNQGTPYLVRFFEIRFVVFFHHFLKTSGTLIEFLNVQTSNIISTIWNLSKFLLDLMDCVAVFLHPRKS